MICSRCDPAHESQDLPGTDQYDAVELRSYRDVRETAPPKVAFVAPTVEIFRRETMRITLNNRLVIESNCARPDTTSTCRTASTAPISTRMAVGLVRPATATTLLISINPDTLFVRQGYTFYVHTRYQRYIGDFVLHCHILDHEDKGMMQNVSIGIPDGRRSQH